MILCISEGKGCRIAAFDWNREDLRFLTGDVMRFQSYAPEGRAEGLTFVREEESGERSIVLMTFDDMEEKTILTADWIVGWLTWDSRGRRCFFTRDSGRNGQRIYIYDRIEESIEWLDLDLYDYNISWVKGDRALLYRNMVSEGLVLRNLESGEEKRIALPFVPKQSFWVHGLNNYVLLETYPEYDLWVLDLIREKWRRIY